MNRVGYEWKRLIKANTTTIRTMAKGEEEKFCFYNFMNIFYN